jgi:coproporphyrinogen III oxidase-like Fe-S oxidoreductase
MSYAQNTRKNNIKKIKEWIDQIKIARQYTENQFPIEDEIKVKQLAMLQLGCTKERAEEYIDLIFGRL